MLRGLPWQVLIQSGADMNRSSEDGFAPLHVAALYGQADVVAALVKLGADVNKTIETRLRFGTTFNF